ncbi:MAG: aminotransferase class V-fold PLP-dependent enzyme [Alphaproteobacteria bacterium]|nr:aminotransferase class V-fold PLP-dependent enzyme [Alphaproteobacteria bacterium]
MSPEFVAHPERLYSGQVEPGLDVVKARRETPGCQNVLHFNNAGAALMPEAVHTALTRHLDLELQLGGYEAAARAERPLNRVYDSLARLVNCSAQEIAVVENATRAWDMAFYALNLGPGDRILTAAAEYASNYIAYLQVARRTGARVEAVPSDETGQISLAALEESIADDVKLIAITHVPTNGGLVNPAAAVGRLARQAGIPFLLDACQSVGQMPIDVEAIGCDMLSATGRKYLRGPRGTGFLYVRKELIQKLEPPFLDLHSAQWVDFENFVIRPDARRFENWESYVAGRAGLAVAVEYALEWGLEAIYARVQALAGELRQKLATIPGLSLHDQGVEQCGIVSFAVADSDHEELMAALGAKAINVSVSPRNYTRLDMQARGLDSLVRASVHYYNDEDEIDRFFAALEDLAG